MEQEITFQVTSKECQRVNDLVCLIAIMRYRIMHILFALMLLICLGICVLVTIDGIHRGGLDWGTISIFILLIVIYPLSLLYSWAVMRVKWKKNSDILLHPILTRISPEGFYQKSILSEGQVHWQLIEKLQATREFFLFWLRKSNYAYFVPRRVWPSPEAAEAFLNQARIYWEEARKMEKS